MSYKVTRSTPDTPWLSNALLALHHKHLAEWQSKRETRYEPIPESAYSEWWYTDYGSGLTYEVTLTGPGRGAVKWTVDFADEKEYLMFLLRWT